MNRRRSRRIWFVMLGVFVAVFLFSFLALKYKNDDEVDAANMAAFDPGYIISDYQMSNYNSMSEGQIQNFLSSKGRCGNTNFSGVGTRVGHFSDSTPPTTWHVVNGHTVCLAEENINGESAAHIIWQAAQDYRINPQVLIVLLQKETGLITDPIPNSWDYQRATGYGCPDNAPCSAQYYGFKNQVRKAAELFRIVLDNGYSKYPVGGAWVQWSTHSECGSGWVNIKNRATSALYRYTPYQPNAAALASSYGSGDYCSQYGNRNFYSYFEDWFGGATKSQSSTKIPNGTYYIKVASNDMAIDVKGGASANGTNIQLYTSNNSDAQKWKITYNSDTDDYNIINALSKKALDVNAAGVKDGTNIQLWDSNKTCAQRWKIVRTSGNVVKLISSCSTKVIDINSGSMADGANIQIWEDNGTDAQKWKLVPVEVLPDGLYSIASSISDKKMIDIAGGARSAKDGTNIQIWDKNDTPAQRWYIERGSDGYYTIRSKQTGKVLDIRSGEVKNGANIQAWTSNGTCAQKWQALKVGSNYTFISACSYKVIDLASANTRSGGNINTYSANNTAAQKWHLIPIEIVEDGEYRISSALSEKMMIDVSGGSDKSGTNVQTYENNGTNAQKWQISYDKKEDFYKITNSGSGKSLDVYGAGRKNWTNIQMWDYNGTCAQKWTITKINGKYVIISGCSDLVVDIAGGGVRNGANIQLYESNGTKAQRWSLLKN